jgi:hypothetical protein
VAAAKTGHFDPFGRFVEGFDQAEVLFFIHLARPIAVIKFLALVVDVLQCRLCII